MLLYSVLLCTATAYKEQTKIYLANSRNSCLPTSAAKKITEDISHKDYTEKGAITGIWLVLSTLEVRKEFTGFQVATS